MFYRSHPIGLENLLAAFLCALLVACSAAQTSQPTPQSTVVEGIESEQLTVLSAFSTADFSGPSICSVCHMQLKDEASKDVSMPTMWRSTMMANSAKDPVWQAKVSSEVARLPQLQAEIEKKCVSCHMPMASIQAETDGQTIAALGDGFYNSDHPLHEAATDGVSCTLCHQVQADNLGTPESFSGGYAVDTSTTPPNRIIFGPYQQPDVQQMQNMSQFTPAYGKHMDSAEHCGTCHNLYTPYVDAEGSVLGEFPEQTPYTEWQYSRYSEEATSCQSCHMPLAEGGVVISTIPGGLPAREPFYQHYFVGGNAFMSKILAEHAVELGVTADSEHFRATQERVLDQISSQTAELVLSALERDGDILTARLHVKPLTGHKFPTSFPSRRAWLHLSITDSTGTVIFESGKPNPDGTIDGNAADTDLTAFEPHYETITQPDQVQIYEPIMGNSDGEVTYTLLRAAEYLKDNRLLPQGTDKTALPADIAVCGEASGDENFVGGSDQVTYEVDVSGAQGPFTVNAELLYQPLSHAFIQDLLIDPTPLTERFGGYYELADRTPLRVTAIAPASAE